MSVVKMSLGNTEVLPAQRASSPGWRDPRLWIGVALVAVSVVAGARVLGGSDDTVAMWSLRSDMAPGDVITPSDLVKSRVHFSDPADIERYFTAADTLPATRYLVRGIGAGELLPRSGLGESDPDTVQVSVSLPRTLVPPTVKTGATVDLWITPEGSDSGDGAKRAVESVVVVEAPSVSSDLSGSTTERQVVLGVPDQEDDLAKVLAASNSGRLMLVGRG